MSKKQLDIEGTSLIPRYITQDNWKEEWFDNPSKSHLMPSKTLPDQSYTIEELFARHAAGQLTDLSLGRIDEESDDDQPNFDDPDIEKLMHADIIDKREFMDEGRRIRAELKKQNDERLAAGHKANTDAAIEAEVLRRLESKMSPKMGEAGG